MRKRTLIYAVGTTACNAALAATREALALGGEDCVRCLLVFADRPDSFDLTGLERIVRWVRLPTLEEVYYEITEHRGRYLWIEDPDLAVLGDLKNGEGDGLAACPAAGRVAISLRARQLFHELRRLFDEAVLDRFDMEVTYICVAVGGTGRGALLEAPILAQVACTNRDGARAKHRMILVMATFSGEALEDEYRRRADLGLSAWRLVERGMAKIQDFSYTGASGTVETFRGRLTGSVLVVIPGYQRDPRGPIRGLANVAEIVTATARIVAGLACGLGWQLMLDRRLDTTLREVQNIGTTENPAVRWVSVANEARVWFNPDRLMAAVRAALVGAG